MRKVNKALVMDVLSRALKKRIFPMKAALSHSALPLLNIEKTRPLVNVKRLQNGTESLPVTDQPKIASKYLKKGGKVYIEGSLRTRKWKDQSGHEKEVTEIRADVLQLL